MVISSLFSIFLSLTIQIVVQSDTNKVLKVDEFTPHGVNCKPSIVGTYFMGKIKDLTGQKFGKLTVIKFSGLVGINKKRAEFLCKCDCGKIISISGNCLLTGNTRSCGCFRLGLKRGKYQTSGKTFKHGLNTKDTLYRKWSQMKNRCTNPKCQYFYIYGGRGISVCKEWINDFLTFREWALANGWQSGLTIDRRDNEKGYSPENCRFATMTVQARNTRTRKNNKYGRGVSYIKKRDRYKVGIGINRKWIQIGTFKTKEKAVAARAEYIHSNKLKDFIE